MRERTFFQSKFKDNTGCESLNTDDVISDVLKIERENANFNQIHVCNISSINLCIGILKTCILQREIIIEFFSRKSKSKRRNNLAIIRMPF